MASLLPQQLEWVTSGHTSYDRRGRIIASIMAILSFAGTWLFCFQMVGFWQAFLLGWLPALISAVMAFCVSFVLWPAVVGLILVFAAFAVFSIASH